MGDVLSVSGGDILIGGKDLLGQDYHYMGDFELGARLLTYGGILSTFGGVIINNIFDALLTPATADMVNLNKAKKVFHQGF